MSTPAQLRTLVASELSAIASDATALASDVETPDENESDVLAFIDAMPARLEVIRRQLRQAETNETPLTPG